MKRIKQMVVTYEDDTTETFVGKGNITRGSTYDGKRIPLDDPSDPAWIHMIMLNMVEERT